MGFREDILAGVVNPLRYLPDTTFGLRTIQVLLVKRRRTAVGPYPARNEVGPYTDDIVTMSPRPKVREQSDGTFLVDKITPKNVKGGYTATELSPAKEQGVEFFWELRGDFGKGLEHIRCKVATLDTSKPFTYSVVLQTIERKKPV